jgi:hypothetical protein
MFNGCIIDFYNLFTKSYGKLKVYKMDDQLTDKVILSIANNFAEYFPEIKILEPSIILSKTVAFYFHDNYIIMTTDKLIDFITITYNLFYSSIKKIENFEINSKSTIKDNNLFDICNDILYSYDSLDELVKIQIPSLIVDIISILFFKLDTYGNRISNYQIKSFYMSKKESLINKRFSYPLKALSCNSLFAQNKHIKDNDNEKQGQNEILSAGIDQSHINTSVNMINNDYNQTIENDILFKLSKITNRDIESIKQSLSKLSEKEIKKLYDICNNYNKIIKYNKINNIKDFKSEIERELKRPLSDKQARHSQISIKKVQFYVESILDRKFEIHLTHGINHVKHNFEYGYRLAGLLKNSKANR